MEKLLAYILQNYQIRFTEEQNRFFLSHDLSDAERKHLERTISVAIDEIGLSASAVAAILLRVCPAADISLFDEQVLAMYNGLKRVDDLYTKNTSLETENFRKLLLTLAEDVRVALIIIAERMALMRMLNEQGEQEERKAIAKETSFLYAPLAHRLGLYAIKTEMEDLALKFTEYETYKDIARTLNETKRHRDAYITAFIEPLKKKLEDMGFKFSIKGRTKSIQSIYKKMIKQNTTVDHIYDLFAIRIIIDAPLEREKAECWQIYSVIADMYQPNPKRLRDWLSIPKSNGYESLHTTVLGPDNKWVEVQIRSRRMDEIAEKGVAAHWKYKGIKSDSGSMDDFLKSVREMLENPNIETSDALNDFRLNFYEQEVFVFTPNGDLFKLRKGATVLDFAFAIHTALGCKCVGGKINGKNVPIRHVLHNGDQVEILTSPSQKPSQAWLNVVCTSKAKNKIRQALKEIEYKDAADGRELLERRFKNWKLEYVEGNVSKLSKKLGYKAVSDLYQAISQGKVDMLHLRDLYQQIVEPQQAVQPKESNIVSASEFVADRKSVV